MARMEAEQGGSGIQNPHVLSTMLMRACRVTTQQMISLLQPLGGRVSTTQAQYDTLCARLRSMGHIIENAPGNIAATLGAQSTRSQHAGTFIADGYDPVPTSEPSYDNNGDGSYAASRGGLPAATLQQPS